ncbi:DUF4249 domain-containing protein [Puia sp.]|jgi:hypothetical protein|uniref:DUF4249 domain-containing protein n=1 Tax=Puia sp. TaxID=2045100 RepID=UPI002F41AA3A
MGIQKRHIIPFLLLLLAGGIRCRQTYAPPAIQAVNSYLVVDGFINTGTNSITTFKINRTRNLGDSTVTGIPELHARISIVSDNGATWSLTDTAGNGTYTSAALTLDINHRYSIAITTSDGRKYASDPVPCKQSPPLDSVYWRQPNDFFVYVSSHDPTGNTRYYRYDYTETWAHDATFSTPWGVANGKIIALDTTDQTTFCWTTVNSSNVQLVNNAALSQDIVSGYNVRTIPNGDSKITKRYSILVRQYALTEEAYNYWLLIQKTSDNLGTLFDVQPTQLVSNIHCITNSSEPVIGFLSATSVQQQRIFVYQTWLNNWQHQSLVYQCDTLELGYDPSTFPAFNPPKQDSGYAPYYFHGFTVLILAPQFCLDCRLFGGTNQKPSFW